MARTAVCLGLALLAGCGGSKSGGDGGQTPDPGHKVGGPSGDPTVGAKDCAAVGGECVGVGDCGVGAGFLSETSCQSHPGVACCLKTCGTATEDFSCCDGSAKFRPSCANGELACPAGRTRCAP